jgi:hypothetical protein
MEANLQVKRLFLWAPQRPTESVSMLCHLGSTLLAPCYYTEEGSCWRSVAIRGYASIKHDISTTQNDKIGHPVIGLLSLEYEACVNTVESIDRIKNMKSARYYGPRDLRIDTIPDPPAPGSHEVRIAGDR